MKKYILKSLIPSFFIAFCIFYLTGCTKDENIRISSLKPELLLAASSPNRSDLEWIDRKVLHLHKDTVYILDANYVRNAGEQLFIEEGTLIKMNRGSKITIRPGGIITANGTAAEPIVFTSNAKAGNQGPNWGGIIIEGKSYNNAKGSNGIADDFSGVFKYVRVEFASLTLNAVGNKTILENIMVSYTNVLVSDPSQCAFNIYGGTFNARNLISYACAGPADFFITNGYSGNMQHVLACRHPFFGRTGDDPENALAGVFIQNNTRNPIGARPYTNPIISNLTVIGPNAQNGSPQEYIDTNIRSAALVTTNSTCFHIRNSVILGFPAAGWFLDDLETAQNIPKGLAEFDYSIVQSNNADRAFYLRPDVYPPFTSTGFKNYMLGPTFKNKLLNKVSDFMFEDLENYDSGPGLLPLDSAFILSGANFAASTFYSHPYFNKEVKYLGAVGRDNWLAGWTNFKPLKTNYNFPE